MTTQQRRRAGRPPKYTADTKPRHLSVRLPAATYAHLEQAAAAQNVCITRLVEQAITRYLSPQPSPALAVIDAGLVAMGEACMHLEARCNACPTCKPHVTTTLNVAWPKLTEALDALNPERGA